MAFSRLLASASPARASKGVPDPTSTASAAAQNAAAENSVAFGIMGIICASLPYGCYTYDGDNVPLCLCHRSPPVQMLAPAVSIGHLRVVISCYVPLLTEKVSFSG